MTVTCNDPQHEAERRARADYHGPHDDCHLYNEATHTEADHSRPWDLEPCLICGAPIDRNGYGHDDGCMGLDS